MRQCIVGPLRVGLRVVEDLAVMAAREAGDRVHVGFGSSCAQTLASNLPSMLVSCSRVWRSRWIWGKRRSRALSVVLPLRCLSTERQEANAERDTSLLRLTLRSHMP